MADLFKSSLGEDSTEGLEDEEYEILQETGIIPSSKKRKRSSHFVFAESLEEGAFRVYHIFGPKAALSPRHYL
jgi:hypothetical protein